LYLERKLIKRRKMAKATGEAVGELNIKRCYLKGITIEAMCPECGTKVIRDLGDSYLSYPEAGRWDKIWMYHCSGDADEEFEHEFPVEIKLSISAEARDVIKAGD
jgi:hypothetical protein